MTETLEEWIKAEIDHKLKGGKERGFLPQDLELSGMAYNDLVKKIDSEVTMKASQREIMISISFYLQGYAFSQEDKKGI